MGSTVQKRHLLSAPRYSVIRRLVGGSASNVVIGFAPVRLSTLSAGRVAVTIRVTVPPTTVAVEPGVGPVTVLNTAGIGLS